MTSRLSSSFASQDGQDPELGTPSRSLTGPARRQSESRTQRLSLGKPYARSSLGTSGKQNVDSPSSGLTVTPNRQPSRRFGNATTSSSSNIRTPQQNPNSSSNKKGGLLSGLRQAIFSRPLSWLQGGSAQSDSLPTSRSSNSFGTDAENGAAAQRNAQSISRSNTFASHEFGTTSNSSRPSAFVAPPPSTPSRSPYLSNTIGLASRSGQFGMTGNGSTLHETPKSSNPTRSPSPARSSASAIIRSHGRQRLSVDPSNASRYGNPSLNVSNTASLLGTPGYRRSGSQRGDGSVMSGGSASQAHSSASFAYGFGSERRLGGLTSSASLYGGAASGSHSPLASTSYNRLPSRSPFAIQQRRSLGGSAAGSEFGSLHGRASPGVNRSGQGLITTPVRPVSMFGGDIHGSRPGSVAHSRASSRGNTPKRREWSSLKLAPPNVRLSEGEELMQEYLAMRDAASIDDGEKRSTTHPALNDSRMSEDVSTIDFNPMSRTTTHNGSLKRGASISIDGDSVMTDFNPRKRQMVWDPKLGFISRQEQIAARPPKPVANNEAERLLNALEGMRTTLGDARRESTARSTTPSRRTINVPLAVSSSESSSRRSGAGDYVKAVSPYARAMRKQKMQKADQSAPIGLRSRLRKQVAKAGSDAMSIESEEQDALESEEDGSEEMRDEEDEEADEEEEEEDREEEEGDEEIEEPPRRRQITKSLTQEASAKNSRPQKRVEAPKQVEEEPRTLRSGKVIATTQASPPKKAGSQQQKILPDQEKVAPMSRARFSVSNSSAANKQRAERQNPFSSSKNTGANELPKASPMSNAPSRDKFSVKTDKGGSSTDSENRRSSSLRQGAEKNSRSHVRSGRVGIDNDDDDDAMEDSPSAEELGKIKLPTNLFPQGFTFSSTPSKASSTASSPQIKPLTEQVSRSIPVEAESENKTEGSSLLSRMGGFAEPETSQAASTSSLSSPSPPTFSLSSPKSGQQPPTSVPPVAKPSFSFQPAISSPLAGGSNSSSKVTSSSASPAPSSNFFTAPTAEEKEKKAESATTPTSAAQNGTETQKPIPNFFASSLAKSSAPPAPEMSKPAFSFGTPASSAEPKNDKQKPAFDFAKPAKSTAITTASSTSPFTFGNNANFSSPAATQSTVVNGSPFSFGAPAASKTVETPKPAFSGMEAGKSGTTSGSFTGFGTPSSNVAASNNTPSAPAPAFNFNTSSTTSTEDATKKRSHDDEKEGEKPQQKRGFTGFGAPATSTAPGGSSSSPAPFSFGAPASGSTEEKKSAPFSFGAPPKSSDNETKPNLSFETPSQTPSSGGFGGFGNTSSSASQPAKPAFSFGAPTPTSNVANPTANGSSGFSFGAKTDTNANQSGMNSPAGGSFTFGQPSTTSANASFGQQNNSTPFGSQDNSRQQSPAPFTFGAPATQQNGSSNTAFGGFGQQAAPPSGSGSSFSFGAPAQTNTAQSASNIGGNNGMSFSFSMPMPNATPSAPAFGSGNQMNGGSTGTPGTPPAFVFGASNTGNQSGSGTPTTPGAGGGFNFGAPNPTSTGMAANSMPAGGSLFNIGAPSTNASGSARPVRGMPSRRKK